MLIKYFYLFRNLISITKNNGVKGIINGTLLSEGDINKEIQFNSY